MSFFSSSTYKPQVRVEGFHLPSPGTPPGSSGANNAAASNGTNGNGGGNLNDLFPHSFLPDAFRKFPPPAGSGEGNHDFNDDLVSLIGDRGGPAQPSGGNGNGNATGASDGANGGYDDGYHRTHNIFDISSPIPVGSNHNGGVANGGGHGPGSQPSSLHSPSTSLHDYQHHPPPHFNSTLPALNSSMRYEPPPENNPLTPSSPHPNAPPSSYHVLHGFSRHTPSPIHSQQGPPVNGRSRSRSRPPSSGNVGPSSLNSGGVGPARTTRTRRGNSISGTSPPPLHGRPHAILIPGGGQRPSHTSHGSLGGGPLSAGGNSSNTWFMGQGANQNSGEYLPTPESLGSHHSIHSSIPSHHHSHSHSQSGYGPFSLSPPPQSSGNTGSDLSHHLPPLHHMAHSLPKSPMEQHLPHPHTHQHHLSGSGLPKSPLDHSYSSSYGYTNGNGNGGSPSDASPGSLPSVSGSGLGPAAASSGLAALSGGGPVGGVTLTGSNYGLGGIGMNMNIGSGPGASVPPPQGIISGSASTAAASTGDKQAVLANEKRRRRRESHNAVERRRRDNINEKISELATLIPECLLDGSGPPNAKDTGTSVTPPLTEDALVPKASPDGALKQEKDDDSTIAMNSMDNNVVKANKGMILRKSVEYIRYLQQLVTAQGARNRELERELRKFRGSSDSSDSPSSNNGGEGSAIPDDGLEGDDSMSLGIGEGIDTDSMVLHDEFVSSPTLSTVSSSTAGNADGSVVKGSVTRKGHHKHPSSSSRPKPPRLPSMPEEDMEVDKVGAAGGDAANGGGGGSLSPESIGAHEPNGHAVNGEGEDHLERGRTRGVRSANGGLKEEMGEDGVDHSLGGMDNMFGMMNGHHQIHGHHQQQQQQHQGVMGW